MSGVDLLTPEHIGIGIALLWVAELKRQARHAEQRHRREIEASEARAARLLELLGRTSTSVRKVCQVLAMKVDPHDDTGEFDLPCADD